MGPITPKKLSSSNHELTGDYVQKHMLPHHFPQLLHPKMPTYGVRTDRCDPPLGWERFFYFPQWKSGRGDGVVVRPLTRGLGGCEYNFLWKKARGLSCPLFIPRIFLQMSGGPCFPYTWKDCHQWTNGGGEPTAPYTKLGFPLTSVWATLIPHSPTLFSPCNLKWPSPL